MDPLIEGYRRFRAEHWPEARDRYAALAREGQRPPTMIVTCSDSRVDPATVFNAGPGEMFVVRNVAGLVPVYQPDEKHHGTSAAIEYGVRVLKVSRIVVMGHGRCGGVQAIIDRNPGEARDFVEPWMKIAEPALLPIAERFDTGDVLTDHEAAMVRLSLANLRTFPWIAEAVVAGRLTLEGYHFAVATGVLAKIEANRLVPVE